MTTGILKAAGVFAVIALASVTACGGAGGGRDGGNRDGGNPTSADAGSPTSDDAGNPAWVGSCTTRSGGAIVGCTEYGEGYTASLVMTGCPQGGGTYSAGDCTTANRIGHCDIAARVSGRMVTERISYYPPSTIALATQQCMDQNDSSTTAVFTAD